MTVCKIKVNQQQRSYSIHPLRIWSTFENNLINSSERSLCYLRINRVKWILFCTIILHPRFPTLLLSKHLTQFAASRHLQRTSDKFFQALRYRERVGASGTNTFGPPFGGQLFRAVDHVNKRGGIHQSVEIVQNVESKFARWTLVPPAYR